jgi:hypothetical protein
MIDWSWSFGGNSIGRNHRVARTSANSRLLGNRDLGVSAGGEGGIRTRVTQEISIDTGKF